MVRYHMRIKRAQDLYDVMYPIFIISKVLGLAPYQLHLKDERRLTAHIGIITIARFILIVGTMCYVCFVMDELNFSVNIGGMALRYELYFGTIMTAIVLVLSMTNQKPAIKSITMLKELDADFEQIGFHISYKNAQIFCYAQIVFMLFMFMAMVTLQPFSGSLAYFVIYSIFNVVDVINTTMLFQYVDVLLLIRQRFIWLNRKIRDLSDFSKTIITVHNETHLTHGMPVNVTRRKLETRNLITNLAKIHGKLFAVAKITNRIYGVQLLVTITIRFVMITTQLINTYKLIQDPKLADSVTHSIVAIYLFLHFSKIFMVAAVSENTACKARDTGIYLHGLWDLSAEDSDKVRFFSLQVLQQKLRFTACGFFHLDYSLIHSIIAAITTYLVILIQFDLSKMEKVNCNINWGNITSLLGVE